MHLVLYQLMHYINPFCHLAIAAFQIRLTIDILLNSLTQIPPEPKGYAPGYICCAESPNHPPDLL